MRQLSKIIMLHHANGFNLGKIKNKYANPCTKKINQTMIFISYALLKNVTPGK